MIKKILVVTFLLSISISVGFWLYQINSKQTKSSELGMVLDAEIEVTVDTTIGVNLPTSTPTASPTATSTPSTTATASPTPIQTPLIFYPTPIPEMPQPPVSEEGKFIIYGYGPVSAGISLLGIDVLEKTEADAFGYFEFRNLPFPSIFSYYTNNWYPELCLSAVDDQTRQTHPVCIPPLPLTSNAKVIGPIILPPTVSLTLSEDKPFANQIVVNGKTTPNANVYIFLANSPKPTDIFTIVRTALANYLPKYQLTAEAGGNFEFALADSYPNTWRMYATSEIIGAPSPKSNTLTFINPSLFMKIFLFIVNLLGKLRPYWFYIILIIQILVIYLLFFKYRKETKPKKKKK